MRCPNGDAELEKHVHTDHQGISITHYRCPRCACFWLDSFSANFIKAHEVNRTRKTRHSVKIPPIPSCPICTKKLLLARSDSIPPNVAVWQCPVRHGYYFENGELMKFKEAQETKIKYFKLWNIPVPAVSGFLLASVGFILLSSGFAITINSIITRTHQTTIAAEIITQQHAIVNSSDRSVLFLVTTRTSGKLLLVIKPKFEHGIEMNSLDGFQHYTRLPLLMPGAYTYYFLTQLNGENITSGEYSLIVP